MCKAIEDMISSRTKVLEDRCKALEAMINEGKAEGMAEGMAKGKAEGIAEGKAEGKAEGIAELVENLRKIGVPEEQIQKALNCN